MIPGECFRKSFETLTAYANAKAEREEKATNARFAIANAIIEHARAIEAIARAIVDSGDTTAEAIRRASVDHDGRTIPNALIAIRDVLEHVSR